MSRQTPTAVELRRDGVTAACYLYAGMFGWFLYAFAPTISLLRDEEHTSRSVAALHGTAFAVGSLLASVVTVSLVRRWGRRRTLVSATSGVGVGLLMLIILHGFGWTMAAAFVIGLTGLVGMNTTMATLVEHHGRAGTGAVSEANGVCAAVGVAAPFVVGLGVGLGVGWRPSFAIALALVVVTVLALRGAPHADALLGTVTRGPRVATPRSRSTRRFWSSFVLVVIAVMVENCVSYWSGDLLRARLGVSEGIATGAITALIAGLAIGRWYSGRLSLRYQPETIMVGSLPLALVGWLILWTAPTALIAIVALAVVGLGVAGAYPLASLMLVSANGFDADGAYATCAVGTSIATGCGPFLLGGLGDQFGVGRAFLLVPVLILVGGVALLWHRRSMSAPTGEAPSQPLPLPGTAD